MAASARRAVPGQRRVLAAEVLPPSARPAHACQRTAPSSPSGVTGATWPSLRITLSVTIILFGVQI